jgi:altronate dehydratase small subunit
VSEVRKAIVIQAGDNVATMIENVDEDESVVTEGSAIDVSVTAEEPIRLGHKIALRAIKKGDDIVKYGEVIGRATEDIPTGHHVHVHNVESLRGRGDLARDSK